MSKIDITDSVADIVTKMSEGNPGAMTVVVKLVKEMEKDIQVLNIILCLDEHLELYGSRLYQLWNDCCDRDIQKVIQIVRLYMNGDISKKEILEHVNKPWGEPFEILEVK